MSSLVSQSDNKPEGRQAAESKAYNVELGVDPSGVSVIVEVDPLKSHREAPSYLYQICHFYNFFYLLSIVRGEEKLAKPDCI